MKVIIVGAGEVGFHSARRLSSENKEVVVIDREPKVLQRILDHMDVQTIEGSGSSPRTLEDAGIKDADILLAVTDSDETNLVACTFANILAPDVTKLARIRNEEIIDYQAVLANDIGIATVINPEDEVVRNIESLLGSPGAVDVSDFAEGRVKLVGLWVGSSSLLADTSMLNVKEKLGGMRIVVASIIRNDQLIVPTGADEIRAGDLLYFVCESEHLEKLLEIMGNSLKKQNSILIVGGGNIGLKLAKALERKSLKVKIMDKSMKRCEEISECLGRTVVLHGDGTDQEVLHEENVGNMDVVIPLTGNEETNILSSLLAKGLGAKMCITRINKSAYVPLMRTIGLQHVVSPRLAAVNSILKHVRKGRVISTVSIKDEAEALEAIALSNSDVVGKPIKDLSFPKGSIVLCITRGDKVIVPTGSDVIEPDDRIIILSTRQNIPVVEKALAVKLEKF